MSFFVVAFVPWQSGKMSVWVMSVFLCSLLLYHAWLIVWLAYIGWKPVRFNPVRAVGWLVGKREMVFIEPIRHIVKMMVSGWVPQGVSGSWTPFLSSLIPKFWISVYLRCSKILKYSHENHYKHFCWWLDPKFSELVSIRKWGWNILVELL